LRGGSNKDQQACWGGGHTQPTSGFKVSGGGTRVTEDVLGGRKIDASLNWAGDTNVGL